MKKWLLVIGWTMLAIGTYYVIEVIFSTGFRYLIRTTDIGERWADYTMIANWVIKMVMIFVFGFWYRVREHKWNYRPDYAGAFTIKNTACLLGIGLMGQYMLSMFVALIRIKAPEFFYEFDRDAQVLGLGQGNPVLIIGLVVVLGPIAEELLFRGVIYGKLRENFTVAQAAVISGAIFGIYHKNMIQGAYAALFGVVLAYLFEKTHTIWGAIVMHIMFNLSSYLLFYIKILVIRYGVLESLNIAGLAIFNAVLIFLLGVCFFTLGKRKNRYDEIARMKK